MRVSFDWSSPCTDTGGVDLCKREVGEVCAFLECLMAAEPLQPIAFVDRKNARP